MSLIIGLTGSIASGKSTISTMFRNIDIPVIDADLIARQVVEPGKPAYKKIVETFGNGIILSNGEIDRKQLGQIVFSNEGRRKQLNEIVHPAIREEMLEQKTSLLNQGVHKAIVLDIPLLFESNLTGLVDKILVVYVDEETQLKRLMDRDKSTEEEAMKRINSQVPVKQKADLADAIIDNSGTIKESNKQFMHLLSKWDVL